ncbi:hypothetical protein X777_10007 [Ooceraea biroi]|uniref:GIY-YIG domain-containing protein n=1 Tax=Ooceraea biroi TaxID=2015173 RepID=A0A026W5S5_OOCBI|nr:hypothetical protein X777_10007 [Ooceraea biroi]
MQRIGQTKRCLVTRVSEHKRNINGSSEKYSVLTDHRLSLNHDFDWTNSTVLHKEIHLRKRLVAEMFYIKKFSNTINLQTDTDRFNTVYNGLVCS